MLNVKVVVVTFETGFLARAYIDETGLKWPVLLDETREQYRVYGMLNAGFWDIWGPSTWWAYMKEIARGNFPKKPHDKTDVSQRGGDILIDPAGTVRMHHVGKNPADRPAVATILSIIYQEQLKK
ncbi:MAG: redoxin domain-containing protein [Proteobacteria bacterium]|nr:redoxin domain-containing protein [Pseudomonadota bacterium]MBU1711146.1 redoxin domain-containing protein [Pseudomonadota bacterium]